MASCFKSLGKRLGILNHGMYIFFKFWLVSFFEGDGERSKTEDQDERFASDFMLMAGEFAKMLRDLDQRQSPATGAADPLRRDTSSVALPPVRRPASALRWAMVVLPVAAAVAGAFVWWSIQPAPPVASPALFTRHATSVMASVARSPHTRHRRWRRS